MAIFCLEPAGSHDLNEEIYIEASSESELDDVVVGSSRTWIVHEVGTLTPAQAKEQIKWLEDPARENEVPF